MDAYEQADLLGPPETAVDAEGQAAAARTQENEDRKVLADLHGGLKLVDLNDGTAAESDSTPAEPVVETVAEQSGLESLVERDINDPFARLGITEQDFTEAVGARGLEEFFDPEFGPQRVVDALSILEQAGLSGIDGLRQFADARREWVRQEEEKRAGRQEIEDIKAQLAERAAFDPGSPYAALNSKLDALLADKQQREEQEQAAAQHQQFVQTYVPVHTSAFEMIAAEAQKRGLPAPDVQAMAQLHGQLMHLEPMQAARLAWLGAGGDPGVFGPRRGADKPYHPTANPQGSRTIRGELREAPQHIPHGSHARSLNDLLEEPESELQRFMGGE